MSMFIKNNLLNIIIQSTSSTSFRVNSSTSNSSNCNKMSNHILKDKANMEPFLIHYESFSAIKPEQATAISVWL